METASPSATMINATLPSLNVLDLDPEPVLTYPPGTVTDTLTLPLAVLGMTTAATWCSLCSLSRQPTKQTIIIALSISALAFQLFRRCRA